VVEENVAFSAWDAGREGKASQYENDFDLFSQVFLKICE